MSELSKVIEDLEVKFFRLTKKIEQLQTEKEELHLKLQNQLLKNKEDEMKILQVTSDFENLKMANSILGSDEYKRETKLKINSLIREIDYCIAQLSE
jgi:hypothetical protein